MDDQYPDGIDSLELVFSSSPNPDPAAELVGKGRRYADGGNYAAAARVFEHVVDAYPDVPRHRVSLACAYQDMLLNGSVADPDRLETLSESACEQLMAAVRLDPEYAPAYRSLGALYKSLDAPWRAREMWTYYLEMAPDAADAEGVRSELDELDRVQRLHRLCEEASHLVNHGDAEHGLRLLSEVTEEEPTWYEAWFWTGLACRELELMDRGVEAFATAIELDPASPFAHHELAALLERKGEREAAEGFWRKALDLDPDEPWIIINMAMLLWREERRPESESLFLRVLDLDPANRKLRGELRRLREGEPPPPQDL